jgi:hypothetical protein
MSKITEIRNQYPELNLSVIDLFLKMDGTKTNKYVPLFCNMLSHRFQPYKMWNKRDADYEMAHITEKVESIGINCEGMSPNEIYSINLLIDYFIQEDIRLLNSFREYNERNLIPNRDITSYKNLDDIRTSVGLASLKENEKEMKTQIVKEYEDETWLALRPLTFGASSKYGSATKWCTTYQSDKQYFERYWRRGILVYFINKVTGLKFAIFKSLDYEKELSFWNATDNRVDFLELDIDDYMIPIIRNVLKSDKTNKDLSSIKIQKQVHIECSRSMEKQLVQEDRYEIGRPMMEETVPDINLEMEERVIESRVVQLRPLGREIHDEIESIMEEPVGYETEIVEQRTPNRRILRSLRDLVGIGGAHQVDEQIGYEEDCQDSQG